MTQLAIYDPIILRTKEAFGRVINLHLFRDFAATILAKEDPAYVGTAAPVFEHQDSQPTERYYLQARHIEAVKEFQTEMIQLARVGDDNPQPSDITIRISDGTQSLAAP